MYPAGDEIAGDGPQEAADPDREELPHRAILG
jgi:hypothetical protein